jgi:hypothetical protein
VKINGLENVTLANAGLGDTESAAGLITRDRSGAGLGGASRVVCPDATRRDHLADPIRIVTIDGTFRRTGLYRSFTSISRP